MKFSRNLRPMVCSFVAISLAACQTASLEDAAPTAAEAGSAGTFDTRIPSPVPLPQNSGPAVATQEFVRQGARNEGRYPSVGRPRRGAVPVMTDEEARALENEFSAAKAGQGGASTESAAYRRRLEELRKLARSHAKEAEAKLESAAR